MPDRSRLRAKVQLFLFLINNHDFGIFDTPDAFYEAHGTNLKGPKRWIYQNVVRHAMNRNVSTIRDDAR